MVSYSLDIVVTKRIACNKKFVHLQIGSCKCQYLGALGPNRQWTHPLGTSWPSNTPYFWAYEANRWVKSYLPGGWSFLSGALRLSAQTIKSFKKLINEINRSWKTVFEGYSKKTWKKILISVCIVKVKLKFRKNFDQKSQIPRTTYSTHKKQLFLLSEISAFNNQSGI